MILKLSNILGHPCSTSIEPPLTNSIVKVCGIKFCRFRGLCGRDKGKGCGGEGNVGDRRGGGNGGSCNTMNIGKRPY